MKDRDFLLWIHARLACVYGEDSNTDFMRKLLAIAAATPGDRDTPNADPVTSPTLAKFPSPRHAPQR